MVRIFDETNRRYDLLKCIQFFLIVWAVAGNVFPQHGSTSTLLKWNGPLLTTHIVFFSGILTHLRYRRFLLAEDDDPNPTGKLPTFWAVSNRTLYEYFYCRIIRFAPIYYLVLTYAVVLQIIKAAAGATASIGLVHIPTPYPGILQTIFSYTLLSSWFNAQPWGAIFQSAADVAPFYAPFTLMASLLVTCWVLYPFIGRAIVKIVYRQAWISFVLLIAGTAAVQIGYLLVARQFPEDDFTSVLVSVRANYLMTGTANEFLNPLFKLPIFVLGVLVSEVAHQLRWSAPLNYEGEEPRKFNWFESWVLPYIFDVAMILLILHDLVGPDQQGYMNHTGGIDMPFVNSPLIHRISKYGLSSQPWNFPQWIVSSQFNCLAYLVLAGLLSLNPRVYRSVIYKLFCLDPILYVFPGRTGLIISLIYVPYIFTTPDSWSREVQVGAGFFFFVSALFLISISLYYYFFEPLNLWFSVRLASGKIFRSSEQIDEELSEAEDPITEYKILTSPHYDRFHLKDDKQELKLYKHLEEVKGPRDVAHIPDWFKRVFIGVHAFSDA